MSLSLQSMGYQMLFLVPQIRRVAYHIFGRGVREFFTGQRTCLDNYLRYYDSYKTLLIRLGAKFGEKGSCSRVQTPVTICACGKRESVGVKSDTHYAYAVSQTCQEDSETKSCTVLHTVIKNTPHAERSQTSAAK